MKKFT